MIKKTIHRFLLFGVLWSIIYSAGCGTPFPTQGPVETTSVEEEVEPTEAKPTATLVLDLLKEADDGSPLPPKVVGQNPDYLEEAPLDSAFEIYFDQAMDQEETGKAFQLIGPDGEKLEGEISWPDPRVLRFSPNENLLPASTYTALISKDAASKYGPTMVEEQELEFITAGELQVSQVIPAGGAVDVDTTSILTVIFNRPIVPLSAIEDAASLPQPLELDPETPGHGEWLNTSVYVFRPDRQLNGSTRYRATVPAGLTDTMGIPLNADYTWEFTTTAPSIESLSLPGLFENPEEGFTDVPLDQSFEITFHQPMERNSTQAAFSLTSNSGEVVQGRFEWNEESTQLTFTPHRLLRLGTTYELYLDESAAAQTGGTLREGLSWFFTTVRPPAIVGTSPADGSVQRQYTGSLEIQFASPMKLSTLKNKAIITPAPGEDSEWIYTDWSMYLYGLEPSTKYTVRVLPGMTDVYGNPITEEYSFSFTTGPYHPSAYLAMPYTPALFRSGGPQEFYINTVNTASANMMLYRLPAKQLMFTEGTGTGWGNYEPAAVDLVRNWVVPIEAKMNEIRLTRVPLESSPGQALETGIYYLAMETNNTSYESRWRDSRVVIVATANLTLKTTTSEALVWLTDLNSGAPLPGVPVKIYDRMYTVLAEGMTDDDGLLRMDLPASREPGQTLFAVAGEEGGGVFAFAMSGWTAALDYYEFGVWSDYYALPNAPTAYIYTDRPLYRPDQTVYFKGVVRLNDDLRYSLPDQDRIQVTISSYEEVVFDEILELSENGVFEGSLLLAEEAALGTYSIYASFPGEGETFGYVEFNVAEYRTPEFLVGVSASKTDLLLGETFSATVGADYTSGGAVAGADVNWVLSASSYTFYPEGDAANEGYSFSDYAQDMYYYYQESAGYDSSIIAQGDGQTGEDGRLVVDLPVELSKEGGSRTLTFEANVSDLTGRSVSERVSVTAHKSRYYPGVKPDEYVGRAGQEQSFELIVVDWESQPVPDYPVTVEIVERRWHNVQEEDAQGRLRWVSMVEEIPVTTEEILTGSDGKGTVSFTPPNGGVFMARVTVVDESGNSAAATAYTWAASEGFVSWRQANNNNFDLVVDRDSYQPGDTAEILIASPFAGESYALVTVERGHIVTQEVISLTTNSTVYELPITPEMAPNTYVTVLVIRGALEGQPPSFKVGMAEIAVEREQQELVVEVIPDREQAAPGEEVTYTIRTTDYQGEPVQADVSLSLVDLAVLSLTGPNTVPVLDYFYPHRYLSVMTSVPLLWSIEEYNAQLEASSPTGEGQGSGGGKGAGALGIIEIRGDFKDTAYWQASVLTDENGEAQVSVTLPDNLTTWRMDARAVTDDTRAGQTTSDVLSTKPLLVRPQTPRFFVAGDKAWLSAAIHNNTGRDLAVDVTMEASGVRVLDKARQTITIQNGRQAVVGWDVIVDENAERVDLVFSASGGGYSDASRPTLGTLDNQGIPVYRYEVFETVGTAGSIGEEGARTEGISLPLFPGYDVTEGEVVIDLAPSLAAGMTTSLEYLEHFPYECTEQTVSRFLPNLMAMRALREAGLSDPELERNLQTQVNIALQKLYNQQHADGGWGWWPSGKSDVLVTAYVVFGLTEARNSDFSVDEQTLQQGLSFLSRNLTSRRSLDQQHLLNRQAFVLFVLAHAGSPAVSQTVQLYDIRQSLSMYARAFLAMALHVIDPGDTRLDTIMSDLISQATLSATGAYWDEAENDSWNWNTDTRSTAIILSALIRIDPQNQLNQNVVRWLMVNREGGHWNGTQETAWVLMALTDWLAASGELEASYNYQAAINGEELARDSVDPQNLLKTRELRIAVAELFTDQVNRLVIARSEGSGSLYYTAHLDVSVPVEHVDAIDRGLILSRSYYRMDDLSTPVTQAEQGEILLAKITIVVPSSLHYVIIEDPLPAGLEAVDQDLRTSQSIGFPTDIGWSSEENWYGWGWWFFEHAELRDEKLVLSVDELPAGTYEYTYRVRATTPGEYRVIPTTGQEFYFPEVYGRGEGALFRVLP